MRNAPPIPDATTARMIVRGVVALGRWVSSDNSPALSNPTSTYAAINAEMSSGTTYPVVLSRFVVCSTTDRPRSALVVNKTTIRTTPISSQITPTELTTTVMRTLVALRRMVTMRSRQPRTTAFAAPSFDESAESVPTSWKPDQTAGSTTCSAIAAVASVMICAITIVQPANQPTT